MLDLPQKLNLDSYERDLYSTKRRSSSGKSWRMANKSHYSSLPSTTYIDFQRERQATWSKVNNVKAIGHAEHGHYQDVGGYFQTVRRKYTDTIKDYHLIPYPTVWYDGPFFAKDPNATDAYPEAASMSNEEVRILGSHAISQIIPTNPTANLATFLGELREGVPSIVGSGLLKSRLRDYRELGSEYLNVEFGWKPFLSDLTETFEAVRKSNKTLDDYIRNGGQLVRRSYHVPKIESEKIISGPERRLCNPLSASSNSDLWLSDGNYGTLTVTEKSTTERWLSAAFTYSVPSADALANSITRYQLFADQVLGLDVTPEVLWNLAPWSWLFDWFANTGTVITNFSRLTNDNLVMSYAYLMETKTVTRTHTMTGLRPRGHDPISIQQSFTTIRKTRWKASPYGFGLTFDGFSDKQLAILAALGVSRGRR